MSYERISLSLISACSALLGAAIGAWAVTWTERRKCKQMYRERILSRLEEALVILADALNYVLYTEKIEIKQIVEDSNKLSEFQWKHPLLLMQIKVIDKELHGHLENLLLFYRKNPMYELKEKGEIKEVAKKLYSKIEKCLRRIYEIWTE